MEPMKKLIEVALAYNVLVVAWPEITRLAAGQPSGTQATLFEEV